MFKLFMMNLATLVGFIGIAVAAILITIELTEYSSWFVMLPAGLLSIWFAYDKAKVDYEIEQMKE